MPVYGKKGRLPLSERIKPKWDRYPKNWPKISERILKKYHYTCQFCGAKKGEINLMTEKKVIITVAHMDHNKHNIKDYNLLALCTSCHTQYDQTDVWKATGEDTGSFA